LTAWLARRGGLQTSAPDDRKLFRAIQHSGEDPGSTCERPATCWPDYEADKPPRPAVIAIVKRDGGEIGG